MYRCDRFQSTLPRRERQIVQENPECCQKISIHAPAKGATPLWPYSSGLSRISIHAPAKGATYFPFVPGVYERFQSTLPRRERRKYNCAEAAENNFNPRSREGSDASVFQTHHSIQISIHAPAKGATDYPEYEVTYHEFQSTLPRRERLQSYYIAF